MIAGRSGLPSARELVATLRGGLVENIIVDGAVLSALEQARACRGLAAVRGHQRNRGRDWETADYKPTRIAGTFPEAIDSLRDRDQRQRR